MYTVSVIPSRVSVEIRILWRLVLHCLKFVPMPIQFLGILIQRRWAIFSNIIIPLFLLAFPCLRFYSFLECLVYLKERGKFSEFVLTTVIINLFFQKYLWTVCLVHSRQFISINYSHNKFILSKILMNCLLCTRHCVKHWVYSGEQKRILAFDTDYTKNV